MDFNGLNRCFFPLNHHPQKYRLNLAQWRNTGGLKQKHKKQPFSDASASHLAVRLCALRHWKRVSMPPTTQSLRHPLTRAIHFAPRIKTARRFTAKNSFVYNPCCLFLCNGYLFCHRRCHRLTQGPASRRRKPARLQAVR